MIFIVYEEDEYKEEKFDLELEDNILVYDII